MLTPENGPPTCNQQDDPLAYDPEDQVAPHAGEDVAAYAAGYQSDRIRGTLDQHRLYDIIKSALESR